MSMTITDLEFDLADRMRKAMRVADVGVQDMAEYLDVSRNTVGNWINGHITPRTVTLRAFAQRCDVPFEWLKTGKAPSGMDEADSDGVVRPKGFEPPTF